MHDDGNTGSEWWRPPQVIMGVVVAFIAVWLLTVLFPGLVERLGLSVRAGYPVHLYQILTYGFVHLGLLHLLHMTLLVVLPALVLKNRMSQADILAAFAMGAVFGGVAFAVFNTGALVSGALGAWGLGGAAVGAFVVDRRRFTGWETAYVVVMLLFAALGLFGTANAMKIPFFAAGIIGGLWGWLRTPPASGRVTAPGNVA